MASPAALRVLDASNGKVVKTLLNSKDPLASYNVGTVEFTQVTGENGDILNAHHHQAQRLPKPGTRYPVIVYLYNGPHVQLVTNSFNGGAPLVDAEAAQRGYIVFTVDGHGSANRGQAFEQVIFRQLGVTEVKDQLDGAEYLKSLPYVDGTRMAVHGWSFGGHMTTA
ncbi:MAG: prolyl oligopeptidase family serine peptidase [Flavobacteriales bacterium]|nr:prolyl oligopeptidase family serine peptidase [Flavobacteriales bacterium]